MIDIAGNGFNFTNISGIEYFTNLEALSITSNDFLKEVDVSKNTKLITLRLYYATSVTDVDVSGCTELRVLDLSYCNLDNIDITNNTKLTYLSVFYNDITSLDVSNNSELETLILGDADNLESICANEDNEDLVISAVETADLSGVTVSSTCNSNHKFSDLFTLFPNPTTTGDIAILVKDLGLEEGETLLSSTVYDLNNTVVGFEFHGGTTNTIMSFPCLPSGTYVLILTTSNKTYETMFIRQ